MPDTNSQVVVTSRFLSGRKQIFADVQSVTGENLLEVLNKGLSAHISNSGEIEYLYKYYKGIQPVLHREKAVRPEINNKVLENHAYAITNFKVSYTFGSPVQYISRTSDQPNAEGVNQLNMFMSAEEKPAMDRELAEWMHICGVGYRMAMPDRRYLPDIYPDEEDDSPFEIYTLDPRYTFVVRSSDVSHRPLLGVTYVMREDTTVVFSCYTENMFFVCEGNLLVAERIRSAEPHVLGMIPIIEYPLNNARMGCFEPVLPLLDAINETASNRLDGLAQFIQSLMLFHNVDITSDDFKTLREEGALAFSDTVDGKKAEVMYLVQQLDQENTQSLVEHEYNTVLKIVGMPNPVASSGSDSSNNGASLIRNGWQTAEVKAKETELIFSKSEKEFLKLVLRICRATSNLNLKVSEVDIRFTRTLYEDSLVKSQILTTMLQCVDSDGNPLIDPKLAYIYSNMFSDPQMATSESEAYHDRIKAEREKKAEETAQQVTNEASTQSDSNPTD